MTVTVYNEVTGVKVKGVSLAYIQSWNKMGFKIVHYDSSKIVPLQQRAS